MNAKRILPRAVLVVGLAGAIAWTFLNGHRLDSENLQLYLQNLGASAPLGFIALFAVATVLFLPATIFGLAGGALFGPLWGSAWNLIGGTLGATLAFMIARYVASSWVAHRAGGRLKEMIEGVEAEGWRFVAFVRLVPLFPFNLLNYALGLARIRLGPYVVTSLIAMAPGTIAYAWLGHAGREAAAGGEAWVRSLLIALAILALVTLLPSILRRLWRPARDWVDAQELHQQLVANRAPLVIDVRGRDEFNSPGHIRNARNVPLSDLPMHLEQLQSAKARRIALVCRTAKRSAQAASLLDKAGFADVVVLRGGMEQWNRAGFEVVRTPTTDTEGSSKHDDCVHPE